MSACHWPWNSRARGSWPSASIWISERSMRSIRAHLISPTSRHRKWRSWWRAAACVRPAILAPSRSSPRAAEMVKLLENTFRMVNIGLVNEIALMCDRLGLDVWEVVKAAATKPFGFMPFYPGPGLGGHCIPIDPFYLSWKAKQTGFEPRFIELAGVVNAAMPQAVVDKVMDVLNLQRKSLNGARVVVAGVAYKRDVTDLRESPSLDVM